MAPGRTTIEGLGLRFMGLSGLGLRGFSGLRFGLRPNKANSCTVGFGFYFLRLEGPLSTGSGSLWGV